MELIGRSNWVNVHECDHCGNVFGIAAKDFTEAELFKEHTRDYALVPCEGSGCEGGNWLFCARCRNSCGHCPRVICDGCTYDEEEAYQCTYCHEFVCRECEGKPELRDVAAQIGCFTCSELSTCARCAFEHGQDPARRHCDECGEARCYRCYESNRFKNQPEPPLRRCAGRCKREMCEKCAGTWHFVSGLGISTLRFCTGCYDALSDASASDED